MELLKKLLKFPLEQITKDWYFMDNNFLLEEFKQRKVQVLNLEIRNFILFILGNFIFLSFFLSTRLNLKIAILLSFTAVFFHWLAIIFKMKNISHSFLSKLERYVHKILMRKYCGIVFLFLVFYLIEVNFTILLLQ